jgi:hypothetical protein
MEVDNFKTLKTYADKLSKDYDTYLPIYYNEQYQFVTIRFAKTQIKPEERCTYDIDYTIKVKQKDDSNRAGFANSYVNCYINSMKFVSRIVIDQGVELVL